MSIVFSPQAKTDLAQFLDYLRQHSPKAADRMEAGLEALLAELERGAFDGPEVVLPSGARARSWAFPPVKVFYRRRRDGVLYVLRVYHGRRRPIAKQPHTKRRDTDERGADAPVFWPPRRG